MLENSLKMDAQLNESVDSTGLANGEMQAGWQQINIKKRYNCERVIFLREKENLMRKRENCLKLAVS